MLPRKIAPIMVAIAESLFDARANCSLKLSYDKRLGCWLMADALSILTGV